MPQFEATVGLVWRGPKCLGDLGLRVISRYVDRQEGVALVSALGR